MRDQANEPQSKFSCPPPNRLARCSRSSWRNLCYWAGLGCALAALPVAEASLVFSPVGGAMIYVDAVQGNDATGVRGQSAKPFKTIFTYQPPGDFGEPPSTNGALAVAQPGDVIKLAPGIYTNTQSIALPPNCSLVGSGRDITIIRSSATTYTFGPVVQPGDNSTVAGVTIECLKVNDTFRNPLGVNMLKMDPIVGTSRAFTNATIYSMRLVGQSDAVYIDHTNTISARFYDVEMQSDWDGVLFSTRGNAQSFLEFANCSIDIQSRNTITHDYVAGLLVDEGTVRWTGGSIVVRDGPQLTMAVWARQLGAQVELHGVRLGASAARGLVLDVFNAGSVQAWATVLNTNRVAGGGTTFVHAWSPEGGPRLSAAPGPLPLYTLHGGLGQNYRVDISSNMVDWTPFVVLPAATEKVKFSDPTTAGVPRRFYRLTLLP